MKILVSLVGEQPTPNLIPLFDKRTLAGPEEGRWRAVKFLASAATWKVGENLLKALEADSHTPNSAVAGVARMELTQVEAWSLENARQNIKQALEQVRAAYPDDTIVVNFTGGTKIMSLAAYQAAVEMGVEMVYVNTDDCALLVFDSKGQPASRVRFEVNISIETQLRAAGREITSCLRWDELNDRQKELATLAKWIGENYVVAFKNVIYKVKQADDQRIRELKRSGQNPPAYPKEIILVDAVLSRMGRRGKEALAKIADAKIWSWNESAQTITIHKAEDWDFVNGIWVEWFACIALIESGYFEQDKVLAHVKVAGFEGDLDILATRNGRLGVIECKTSGPEDETELSFVATKTRLHQTLFGGPYAKSYFVRAKEEAAIWEKVTQQYGIEGVIEGPKLTGLAKEIANGLGCN